MAKYIVTSALPYINGVKHLGNLIGSLLPADVYARYLRMGGHDVLCVCGTDEHGTPAQISAMEEGMDVTSYADKYYAIQKKIYEDFGLSFDYFGRTSSPENHAITQHLLPATREDHASGKHFALFLSHPAGDGGVIGGGVGIGRRGQAAAQR